MASISTNKSQPALLEARDLCVFRGDEPLFDDISLTLFPGQLLQIEGSNGSGKTTLLRVLCALALADAGEVFWRGKKLAGQRASFFSEVLYLGHKSGIKAELTALENLAFYQQLSVSPSADQHQVAAHNITLTQALEAVNLADKAHLPCAVLSAGQQRRVALARLLLSPARVWILDEPLTALDVAGRTTVENVMMEHVKSGGSLIYTTHQALPFHGAQSDKLSLDS